MDRRNSLEWKWKGVAIRQAESSLQAALTEEQLATYAFVPMPPSKAKNDALYDARKVKILKMIGWHSGVDVRELVVQMMGAAAAHDTGADKAP